jgi:hypothetical protein
MRVAYFMSEIGDAERFLQLTAEEQAQYIQQAQKMTALARDHAVPIIIAPPVSVGGKVNGGTGFVVRLGSESFVFTALHVLAKYEDRLQKGEAVYWQVGKLPPFDPLSRIAWRKPKRDVVLLRISDREERDIGPRITSRPSVWPPCIPHEGELVVVAGYPLGLREDNPAGWIGAGPYSALFRVATVGEGYCKCRIEQKDLISFCEAPVPPAETEIGGVSGGPALLVGSDYPIVGVVTEHWYMEASGLGLLEFATLEDVDVKGKDGLAIRLGTEA